MPNLTRPRIDTFTGLNRWASNFYSQPLMFRDVLYPTAEHAYQDAKTRDPITWKVIEHDAHAAIMASTNPADAKRAGKEAYIPIKEWNTRKLSVMLEILRVKFAPGTSMAARLLATNDVELVHGNFHKDSYWGVFRGKGSNHLGRLLMQVRDELRRSMFNVHP